MFSYDLFSLDFFSPDLALVMLFGNLVPIWGPGMALHRLLPGREAER